MLRAVLLDFNGILVDDEAIHEELLREVLAGEGIELPPERYREAFAGRDDRGGLMRVLGEEGVDASPADVMALVARKARGYQEVARRRGFSFFPGALELVEAAARQGLMLGLVSGALREEIVQALHQASLRQHFKVMVTAEDVREGKPAPEAYLLALDLLNAEPPLPERLLHPHEVLAVEDSPAGVEAAREAGLTTLAVASVYDDDELAAADLRVRSLAEIDPQRLQELFSEASRR
ncbi:MAG: HAD family phosphatase [Thermoanaerobaculia bacterium]